MDQREGGWAYRYGCTYAVETNVSILFDCRPQWEHLSWTCSTPVAPAQNKGFARVCCGHPLWNHLITECRGRNEIGIQPSISFREWQQGCRTPLVFNLRKAGSDKWGIEAKVIAFTIKKPCRNFYLEGQVRL